MFPKRDFFLKVLRSQTLTENKQKQKQKRVPVVLIPGKWGHKQAEDSIRHCSGSDGGHHVGPKQLQVPFLNVSYRGTELNCVSITLTNRFKRAPHLQKNLIKRTS